MRRNDRARDSKQAKKFLESTEHGVLSLVSPDNSPYGIPLNFVLKENNIYFHCATQGKKIDILAHNAQASFCAVASSLVQPEQFATNYESAIATGTVEELFAEEKRQGLLFLLKKYSPEHIDAGLKYTEEFFNRTKVFKIKIESITGKARQ